MGMGGGRLEDWMKTLPVANYRNFQTHSPDGATDTCCIIAGIRCGLRRITLPSCLCVGALLDATQSYSSAFYFAGAMFIAAGLLFYLLPLTQRLRLS